MLRTFFALDPDESFLGATTRLMDELRAAGPMPHARWVSPLTLHVTLRFLGATDEAQVPALVEIARALASEWPSAVPVHRTSLLAFPDARRAHVLSLAIDDGGTTAALAARAEDAVVALGFRREARAFRPHLTVARFRKPSDLRALLRSPPSIEVTGRLDALTFYESQLGREGAVHTPLARHVLA